MILHRHAANPILTRGDVPPVVPELTDATSVFNPGAVEHAGRVWLLLRVQSRGRRTFLLPASSLDGVSFEIAPRVVTFPEIERSLGTVHHVYDPRITRLEDQFYVMFAIDTDEGCRLGTARTRDFAEFEWLAVGSDLDVRNGVLFPERRGGRFVRLDRPHAVHVAGEPSTGSEIVLSSSDDLRHWTREGSVIRGREHFWDERVGSGPPPVKTREGWLHLYHGVATHFGAANVYQVGALLLDLDDPTRVLGRTRNNILEPRELYEQVGQVPNVVFPGGMVVRDVDAEGFAAADAGVLLYYGAADTSVALATSTVSRLIEACDE